MMRWSACLLSLALLNAGCGSSSTPTGSPPTPPPTPPAPQDQLLQARSPLEEGQQRAAMAPYVEKARQTYPEAKKRYLEGLPRGSTFYAVTRVQARSGESEQVFIAVDAIRGGEIRGRIASDIVAIKGLHKGDPYRFPESELLDWLIHYPDGREEGNEVGRFIERWQKTRRK